MKSPDYFETPQGRKIAYHQSKGKGIGIVFLGGFKSDMDGTKAIFLEKLAIQNNRPFIRFDYSGHGQSSEKFTEGCIGDWKQDALALLDTLTSEPQILVGSSMGGWISLLLCREVPEKICGLIGIAAAPDFTEDSMWASFSELQKKTILENGYLKLPSEYDDPYIITKKLIDDGKEHLILKKPLNLNCPCRFLQGTADTDVDISVAINLINHLGGSDIRLTFIKDADHRFSSPENLRLISKTIHSVTKTAERLKNENIR